MKRFLHRSLPVFFTFAVAVLILILGFDIVDSLLGRRGFFPLVLMLIMVFVLINPTIGLWRTRITQRFIAERCWRCEWCPRWAFCHLRHSLTWEEYDVSLLAQHSHINDIHDRFHVALTSLTARMTTRWSPRHRRLMERVLMRLMTTAAANGRQHLLPELFRALACVQVGNVAKTSNHQ